MPFPLRITSRVAGFAVLACGIVLLGVSAWLLNRSWKLANGQEETARVIGQDVAAPSITIRYRDLQGGQHEPTIPVSAAFARKHPKNAKVVVTYVRDDPQVFELVGQGRSASGILVFLMVGLLVAGVGVVMVLREPGKPDALG